MSLWRPRFVPDAIVTTGDLESLVDYVEAAVRLQAMQGGVGIRHGLQVWVQRQGWRRPNSLCVSPGVAVDQLGRVIQVEAEVELRWNARLTGFVVLQLMERVDETVAGAPGVQYVRFEPDIDVAPRLALNAIPLAQLEEGEIIWHGAPRSGV